MSRRLRAGSAVTRRRFLTTLASATATIVSLKAPALSRLAQRPVVTHGVQSGDVSTDSGMVWARTDRPARMLIEAATTETFKDICYTSVVDALPETDFTAKALIDDLPPGQDIIYRLCFEDLSSPKVISEPTIGRFRTAPSDRRSISFVWSGDTAGQGWGIDASRGGMRTYASMRRNQPDFFVHCGDSIYADCTIPEQQKLPNGEIWRNVVTEDKSKVATTLADYRGNYKYNLLDANLRAFNAEVPIFAQWDNHEVMEDWWPGEVFDRSGYDVKSASLLAARGCRAFHEFMPLRYAPSEPGRIYRKISYGPLLDLFLLDMRSYRGSNEVHPDSRYGPDAYLLGPAQVAWLKRELKASRATWKVIAADMPIGLYVVYDGDRKFGSEAVAQGDGGVPLGRELEIADLLSFIKREKIQNTVWFTADVHYTAAHYYDPNKAKFQDFDPFWEFVSGPIHAGSFGPNDLDATFGPQLMYVKAPTKEQGQNLSPAFDLQFFGHVAIDGTTEQMNVSLRDWNDAVLWAKTLDPQKS